MTFLTNITALRSTKSMNRWDGVSIKYFLIMRYRKSRIASEICLSTRTNIKSNCMRRTARLFLLISVPVAGSNRLRQIFAEKFTEFRETILAQGRIIYDKVILNCVIGKYSQGCRHTKDNKLRQFCFRFLHRTIVTKKELKLYHFAEDNKCIYCFNADSIEHTFIDCKESVKRYSQIISWFNHSQSTEIILSKEQIAFHNTCHVTDVLSDPLKRKLDLLIILVKQYIYTSKYLQKELSLDELANKLIVQWKLEKCA